MFGISDYEPLRGAERPKTRGLLKVQSASDVYFTARPADAAQTGSALPDLPGYNG